MKFPGATIVVMFMLWTAAALAQTRAPASQPATQNSAATVSEVATLMAAGQYADALRAINRLLPSAKGGGIGQDRHELLMMRAEAQLHQKNNDAAILTLGDLARESQEAADVKGQSEAIAFATLIQRSSNSLYFPKAQPGSKSGLNILEPESRRSAYSALLADELAALRAQQNAAQTNKTLAPLLEITREFNCAQAIERAVSDDVKQTTALARDLSKWVTNQIENALDEEDARITRISADVGRSSSTGSRRSSGAKRGLEDQQSQTLHEIVAECEKIPTLVQELNKAFGQFEIAATLKRAKAIGERASTILDGGYAPPVKRPARSGR